MDWNSERGKLGLASPRIEEAVEEEEVSVEDLTIKREWDDRPLRWKLGLVVSVSLFSGLLVGMAEQWVSRDGWVMALGSIFIGYIIYTLAQRWVCQPIERLSIQIESDSKRENSRPFVVPKDRQDEVGTFSRAFYHMSVRSLKDRFENNQLRRTLDDRVTKATHRATIHLKAVAMKDPLTGLGNRRALDENLEAIFESCADAKEELIVVGVDLDYFKTINDQHGHAVGGSSLAFGE